MPGGSHAECFLAAFNLVPRLHGVMRWDGMGWDDLVILSLYRSLGLWSHSRPTRMKMEISLHEDHRFVGSIILVVLGM